VPLVAITSYAWYELSDYSNVVHEKREDIINSISASLGRYFPITREGTRASLEVAFAEAVTRSAEATQELRKRAALLLASLSLFFFTIFYVLTQRIRLAAYIKVRIPGDYLPLYARLWSSLLLTLSSTFHWRSYSRSSRFCSASFRCSASGPSTCLSVSIYWSFAMSP
jgi:predicted PurR-regulated permease PerM